MNSQLLAITASVVTHALNGKGDGSEHAFSRKKK
jgi:hypothetical protein